MDKDHMPASSALSDRAKLVIVVALVLLVIVFMLQARGILAPFLWALLVSYLLNPIVNYLNLRGKMPRLWCVFLIYVSIGLLVLTGSRYLIPRLYDEGIIFLEDIPRLVGAVKELIGARPLGIDIDSLVAQLLAAAKGYTGNAKNTGHLVANAVETFVKIFLFLVSTFYLLMDAPRLKNVVYDIVPPPFQEELGALGRQINITWQQYIRGELVLFAIMAVTTSIGLTILGVPGAVFLGLATGALELLPLVGPITAGALAISVAYFNGTNPWGWSQLAYGGSVALLYLLLRQAEDYFVIPHVLGRAVRLHPLVVLFAVTTGGVVGGLLGLAVAVPVAASIKAISIYLYAKLLDLPVEFAPIRTLGGSVIEIPIHGRRALPDDVSITEQTGSTV